jgi:hypothetical protein
MTTEEVVKVPVFVELIGEAEAGKTHLSCLFPKPIVFDTTPKKEAYVIVRKLHSDWKRRHIPVRSFEDIRKGLEYVKRYPNDFKTVVFDTAADLRDLGSKEYLEELNKAGKERQALMPQEYRWVNEKIDAIIDKVTSEMGLNLVFVSQMRDEWKDGKATGRRVRKGYPKTNFQADLRLYLSVDKKVDEKTMQYVDVYVRKCLVVKNRFRNKTDAEWVKELNDLSWKGVVELCKLKDGERVE